MFLFDVLLHNYFINCFVTKSNTQTAALDSRLNLNPFLITDDVTEKEIAKTTGNEKTDFNIVATLSKKCLILFDFIFSSLKKAITSLGYLERFSKCWCHFLTS